MYKGKVKWFNDEKGFGFIESPQVRADVFVHYTIIETTGPGRKTLTEGQDVEFEFEDTTKGLKATRVVAV